MNTNGTEALYNAAGQYVGDGGAGYVTTPGQDPSDGAHQRIVTTGEQAIQAQAQDAQAQAQAQDAQAQAQAERPLSAVFDWSENPQQPAQAQTVTREQAAARPVRPRTGNTRGAKNYRPATPTEITEADDDTQRTNPEPWHAPADENTGTDRAEPEKPGQPKKTRRESISEEDYNRLKAKQSRTLAEDLAVYDYENPEPDEPEMPEYPDADQPEPPAPVRVNKDFSDTYARLQEQMRAAGDTPEQKARRAKARRAARMVAAIADVLQAAGNMWATARGANAARLTSHSAAVAKKHEAEDAAAEKRAARYVKELEAATKRDDAASSALNKQRLDTWAKALAAAQKARDARWRGDLAQFNAAMREYQRQMNAIQRGREKIRDQHARRELEAQRHGHRTQEQAQRHADATAQIAQRGRESRKTKQAPGASGKKGKGGGKGTFTDDPDEEKQD